MSDGVVVGKAEVVVVGTVDDGAAWNNVVGTSGGSVDDVKASENRIVGRGGGRDATNGRAVCVVTNKDHGLFGMRNAEGEVNCPSAGGREFFGGKIEGRGVCERCGKAGRLEEDGGYV